MFAALAVGLGIALGAGCGGKLAGLEHAGLRFEGSMLALFLLQAVARGRLLGPFSETPSAVWVWAITSVVLLTLLAINWRQAGIAIAALGILLNLNTVLVNMGMPVDTGWQTASQTSRIVSVFYHAANPGSVASALGDVLRATVGGSTYMLSVGDVLTGVGVLVFVVSQMLPPGGGRSWRYPTQTGGEQGGGAENTDQAQHPSVVQSS